MSSVIPDYNYDIFISYRHNDNKFDGWVTEFVENLKKELQATVKYPLTVYFDENPEDGLRESHLVEDSLNDKIRSVIFIPIVSQTYCDTTSYAWQKEFKVFQQEMNSDGLGPKVRLRNGNVAGRILPIKIHNLENEDLRFLESELNGLLRSIDFIYTDQGINRPLRIEDDKLLSGKYPVLYRNQINIVANAIKDIITSLKTPGPKEGESKPEREIPKIDLRPLIEDIPGLEEMSTDRKKVYLAYTAYDLKEIREEMSVILDRAGFDVIPAVDCPTDDELFKSLVEEKLSQADFSLHLMSGEYGRRFEAVDHISFPRHQLEEAKKKAGGNDKDFKVFIWYKPETSNTVKAEQQEYISQVRQEISPGMMFSNCPNANQLIDDIRATLTSREEQDYDRKETEIFFIYNENDEFEANEVTDLISSSQPMEILNILSDGEEEYMELSRQQILKSKLAVIYFKYSADWAVPFTKQIWKEIGGAQSPTTLMLVGEDDPKSNLSRKFKAPHVVCSILPHQDLPEQVVKVYKDITPDNR